MKNGYTVVASGRDITRTKENCKGSISKSAIYLTRKEASERRKVLLSYRSAYAKAVGITEIILKVENGKII